MKRLITIHILCLLALSASAQEHLKIKGVPIDGNLTSFISKLKHAGLEENTKYTELLGQTVLTGEFALLSNCDFLFQTTKKGTVCKVTVHSETYAGWEACKEKYNEMKASLSSQYLLSNSFEVFPSPYHEGDGRELSALALKEGVYRSFFRSKEGFIIVSLDASNNKEGYLTITFEDTANMAKFTKEQEKNR